MGLLERSELEVNINTSPTKKNVRARDCAEETSHAVRTDDQTDILCS